MNSMQDIRITSVDGNRQRLDGGAMFGNVPRALWSRWVEVDDQHRIALACRCMLIEYGTRKILCETGIGNFFEPKLADRYGVLESDHMLLRHLAAHEIMPEAIDMVILSHLHFDHAGGLLPDYETLQCGGDELVFPNAQIVVGAEAWRRAREPHSRDRASFLPELHRRLEASGRLIVVEGESHPDVAPEIISFRYSDGHTPGQMHTVVRGKKSRVIFAGDLIPGEPWVHLPVTMGYDRFPEKLIDEKQSLYQDMNLETDWLFFTHDAKFAASHVRQNEQGKYEACDLLGSLHHFAL